ncbi:tail assembly chaperone, partial [Aduncisulcus paluster]
LTWRASGCARQVSTTPAARKPKPNSPKGTAMSTNQTDETTDALHPVDPRKAREHAADYLGFLAGVSFSLGSNETWELPNPAFLDVEQRKRYRDYQRDLKNVDTELVDHPLIDGKKIERDIYPYVKDGKDFDPDEQLCIALMGNKIYAKFLAAGGVPVRIADWHQGTRDQRGALVLSSRQLLALIRSLPEDSEFKTHAPPPFGRDGDWTQMQKIIAETHNELAAYRASKYAGTPHEYMYTKYSSPLEARERDKRMAAENAYVESARDELLEDVFPDQ